MRILVLSRVCQVKVKEQSTEDCLDYICDLYDILAIHGNRQLPAGVFPKAESCLKLKIAKIPDSLFFYLQVPFPRRFFRCNHILLCSSGSAWLEEALRRQQSIPEPCWPRCRNCNLLKLLLLLRVFVKISQLSFNPGSQSVHYKTFSWPFGELAGLCCSPKRECAFLPTPHTHTLRGR